MSSPSSILIFSFIAVFIIIGICHSKNSKHIRRVLVFSSSSPSFLLSLPLLLLLITRAYPHLGRSGSGWGGRWHNLHNQARNQSFSQSGPEKHQKRVNFNNCLIKEIKIFLLLFLRVWWLILDHKHMHRHRHTCRERRERLAA